MKSSFVLLRYSLRPMVPPWYEFVYRPNDSPNALLIRKESLQGIPDKPWNDVVLPPFNIRAYDCKRLEKLISTMTIPLDTSQLVYVSCGTDHELLIESTSASVKLYWGNGLPDSWSPLDKIDCILRKYVRDPDNPHFKA